MPDNILLSVEQIQRRVREMGQQISRDYAGKNLMLICVLPDGFVFCADLIRAVSIPSIVHFVQPQRKAMTGTASQIQIHYGPEIDVKGTDVLFLEGLIQS